MFGRSDDSNDPPKQKTIVPRIISLSLFEMSRDGQVETVSSTEVSYKKVTHSLTYSSNRLRMGMEQKITLFIFSLGHTLALCDMMEMKIQI
jgi:hypothetical protein